jgi:hypothetical protein
MRFFSLRQLLTASLRRAALLTAVFLGIPAINAVSAPVYQTGQYRNLFKEIGKNDAEIDAKVSNAVSNFFF